MNVLKHRFVSAKSDGADATQVQPSHWNDGHAFTGGAAGDVLVRDPSDATFGATFQGTVYEGASAGGAVAIPLNYGAYVINSNAPADNVLYGVAPASGVIRAGTRLTIVNKSTGGYLGLAPVSSAVGAGKFYNVSVAESGTRLAAATASAAGGSAQYVADGANNWIMVTHEQGAPLSLGLSSGNCVGFSCDQLLSKFHLRGRDCRLHLFIVNGNVPTSVPTLTISGLPFTFDVTGAPYAFYGNRNVPTGGYGVNTLAFAASALNLTVAAGGNWTIGAGWYATIDVTIPVL